MTHILSEIASAARKAGYHTPIGKRLSLLIEQIKNGVSPVRTIAEIGQIKVDGGKYIHANHGVK